MRLNDVIDLNDAPNTSPIGFTSVNYSVIPRGSVGLTFIDGRASINASGKYNPENKEFGAGIKLIYNLQAK